VRTRRPLLEIPAAIMLVAALLVFLMLAAARPWPAPHRPLIFKPVGQGR
jgi:hypothetical protein